MRVDSISDSDLDMSGFIITPTDFGCYLNPVQVEPNADYSPDYFVIMSTHISLNKFSG